MDKLLKKLLKKAAYSTHCEPAIVNDLFKLIILIASVADEDELRKIVKQAYTSANTIWLLSRKPDTAQEVSNDEQPNSFERN